MRRPSSFAISPVALVAIVLPVACGDGAGPPPANSGGAHVAASGAAGGATAGEGASPHAGGSFGTAGETSFSGTGHGGAWEPVPCTIAAPTSCPEEWPVYADVAPLLAERCVVCHEGKQGGPWPLNSYAHVTAWRDEIRAALLTCTMPPPEEAPPLPNEDSLLLLTWIRCGMPP